jgi:glutamate dehydrogenase (NAD(P)+)
LDVDELLRLRKEFGDDAIKEYEKGELLPLGTEIGLDVDILVPAARQDVINGSNVGTIKAALVVEGANLPLDTAAQAYLMEKGIPVVPDFVANAGAVVGAGVAMDTRYASMRPDTDAIFKLISDKLRANTALVLQEARIHTEKPHDTALRLAQDRVRAAMELKGRLPRR